MALFVGILSNPGAKCGYFRRTFTQLEGAGGAIMRSKELFSDFPGAKWNGSKHRWVFENLNDSIIQFSHIQNEDNVFDYQSQQFDYIAFDEATQFTRYMYRYLMSRNRVTVNGVHPLFMMATNPGGIGHCVPFGDILTTKGWKDIKDIKLNDKVLSLDKDRNIVKKEVKQIHKYKYQGKLYNFSNKTMDITCTPEHKIARKIGDDRKDKRFVLTKAKELPNYAYIVRKANDYKLGKKIKEFKIKQNNARNERLNQPTSIEGDNFCKFMGWFISEGHTLDRDKEFGISQIKKDNRKEIEKLLKEIGFSYREKIDGFSVSSYDWWHYLKQFGKCDEKYIPKNILNAPKRQLRLFFDAIIKGDGNNRGNGSHYYYTLSKKLADQMAEIGVKLGYIVTQNDRLRKNRTKRNYEVRFRAPDKVGDSELRKYQSKKIDYNDFVYDIGVEDTHNFFIRQNNTVWLSGNSWFKKEFVSIGEPEKPHMVEVRPGKEEQHMFIPAQLSDNIILEDRDPGYRGVLEGMDDIERERLLGGNWDIHAGQFFPRFDRNIHVVEPFEIPAYWKRFISIDYGLDMSAVYWWALDDLGFYYCYKEIHRPNLSLSDLAEAIREKTNPVERDALAYTVASPDLWNRRQETGKSGRQILTENGLSGYGLRKADNRRVEGWRVLREYLKPIPDPTADEDNPELTSRFLFFENKVPNMIRCLPALQHDDNNPDDAADKPHDITHAPESGRYFAMSRPPLKSLTQEKKEELLQKRKERMAPVSSVTGY